MGAGLGALGGHRAALAAWLLGQRAARAGAVPAPVRFLVFFGSVYYGKHKRTVCSVGGATLEILKAYIENQGR